MPTLPREHTPSLSPDLSADTIQTLIDKMEASDVPNLFTVSGEQPAAVFATRDPAVIMVLQQLFEEAEAEDRF